MTLHCTICAGPIDDKRARRGCVTCSAEHQKLYKQHRHKMRDEKKLCRRCKRQMRTKAPQVLPEAQTLLQ